MKFSFLLPTRGRPHLLKRFLDSIAETTRFPDEVEVILGIDQDDPETQAFEHTAVNLKKVLLPPGLSMGMLNRACFEASRGQYVMLINDDVIARTMGWDDIVAKTFRYFKDDVALIHTNDLLFQEKLCTFPILSRKACQAIDVCPADYQRYRIDDHIYDTYALLAELGHRRIIFLSEVIFEHDNYHADHQPSEEVFKADKDKVYVPNQDILKKDVKLYTHTLNDRKANALRLAQMIDDDLLLDKRSHYDMVMAGIGDSMQCRTLEHVIRLPAVTGNASANDLSLTIAVVSADIKQQHAADCIARLKQHTRPVQFDLIILDNNYSDRFSHPGEMNKMLKSVQTDYLVLMDDDVLVTEGWLQGMLEAMDDDVGVVAPMHRDGKGELSFSGVYLMGDQLGTHAHLVDIPDRPRAVPCVCSACLLIDLKKCGHILFNPSYRKYFLDIDYSLRIWQSGYQVKVTPQATVVHLAGATLPHGSNASIKLWNQDLKIFVKEWIDTARLRDIKDHIWPANPFLYLLAVLPRQIIEIFREETSWEFSRFKKETDRLIAQCQPFPLFQSLFYTCLQRYAAFCTHQKDQLKSEFCQTLLERLKNIKICPSGPMPVFLSSYKGYNIVEYQDRLYLVPQTLGPLDLTLEANRQIPDIIQTDSVEQAYPLIDRIAPATLSSGDKSPSSKNPPVLIQEGYKGFNIIRYDNAHYGILQSDGAFDIARIHQKAYFRYIAADTLTAVKTEIDRLFWLRYYKKCYDVGKRVLQSFGLFISNTGPLEKGASPAETSEVKKVPRLIKDGYKQFNIILFDTRYFAIRQVDGEFKMDRLRQKRYRPLFIGHTLLEVMNEIDKATPVDPFADTGLEGKKNKALFCCNISPQQIRLFFEQLAEYKLTLLMPQEYASLQDLDGYDHIIYTSGEPDQTSNLLITLQAERFDLCILPYVKHDFWQNTPLVNFIETEADSFCDRLMMLSTDGRSRLYKGEDIRRIHYNKAYLNSMFQFIPSLKDKTVIDVGASDGLVCDLLLIEAPRKIVGIDVLETVGCVYSHPKIDYHTMDATRIDLPDNHFDVSLSIATLEHIRQPEKALDELVRITQPGGFIYIQAGPLYFSPFGHHMFGYFDNFPWIHLRLSRAEIIEHCRANGIDEQIKRQRGVNIVEYLDSMLNPEHINMLALEDYGLERLMQRKDLEVLLFSPTYEGEAMLTEPILEEIKTVTQKQLITHGFELVLKKQ